MTSTSSTPLTPSTSILTLDTDPFLQSLNSVKLISIGSKDGDEKNKKRLCFALNKDQYDSLHDKAQKSMRVVNGYTDYCFFTTANELKEWKKHNIYNIKVAFTPCRSKKWGVSLDSLTAKVADWGQDMSHDNAIEKAKSLLLG